MPIRSFRRPLHGVTEKLVRMDGSDEPTACAEPVAVALHGSGASVHVACGNRLERVLSVPASIFPGADGWRK